MNKGVVKINIKNYDSSINTHQKYIPIEIFFFLERERGTLASKHRESKRTATTS